MESMGSGGARLGTYHKTCPCWSSFNFAVHSVLPQWHFPWYEDMIGLCRLCGVIIRIGVDNKVLSKRERVFICSPSPLPVLCRFTFSCPFQVTENRSLSTGSSSPPAHRISVYCLDSWQWYLSCRRMEMHPAVRRGKEMTSRILPEFLLYGTWALILRQAPCRSLLCGLN
jgi:hypothetical protein